MKAARSLRPIKIKAGNWSRPLPEGYTLEDAIEDMIEMLREAFRTPEEDEDAKKTEDESQRF